MLLNTEHAASYIEKNIKEMLENPEDYYDDELLQFMIDSHIYGKDWNFRAVGMHKGGERDPLASLRICGGSEDVRDHTIIIYPTTNTDGAQHVKVPESWFAVMATRRRRSTNTRTAVSGLGASRLRGLSRP
eukprot:jgi/Mesvir1/110/Mv01677-RA.1